MLPGEAGGGAGGVLGEVAQREPPAAERHGHSRQGLGASWASPPGPVCGGDRKRNEQIEVR